jgi:hypothetical protein
MVVKEDGTGGGHDTANTTVAVGVPPSEDVVELVPTMSHDDDDDDDDDDMANLFSFGSNGSNNNDNNINNDTTGTSSSTGMNTNGVISLSSNQAMTSTGGNTSTDTRTDLRHGLVPTTTFHTDSQVSVTASSSSSSSLLASLPTFLSQRIQKRDNRNNTTGSREPDSFLELLETETNRYSSIAATTNTTSTDLDTVMMGSSDSGIGGDSSGNATKRSHHRSIDDMHDAATADILNWLDSEDNHHEKDDPAQVVQNALLLLERSKHIVPSSSTSSSTTSTTSTTAVPTLVSLPPVYTSFHTALYSKDATKQQIRELFVQEQDQTDDCILLSRPNHEGLDDKQESSRLHRAELYCRMICQNKSLKTVLQGSLADSFEEWKKSRPIVDLEDPHDPMHHHSMSQKSLMAWIRQQALAVRISQSTGRSEMECETDLFDLVLYHQHQFQKHTPESTTDPESGVTTATSSITTITSNPTTLSREQYDTLLPMVASVVLATNLPVTAAAVVLSQIIPTFIPLLALPPATERWEAALFLHSEFYLLACYHIPLLVFHLDRYIPGWYWPKLPPNEDEENQETTDRSNSNDAVTIGRNLTKQGQIPLSWLVSHLSGECDGTMLPIDLVLRLWDRIVTGGTDRNHSATRFFLTLAVLERHAAALLLLTGKELLHAVQGIWTLENIDEHKEVNEKEWQYEWWPQAYCLQLSTPESVLARLQNVEDEAVQHALKRKQERAEAVLRERLEMEAMAHREAQELKAEEARVRLSRARLVAFYRKHAPEKESNIEQIMESYHGRLDVLDFKLKSKYGEGFNPAVKAKPPLPPKTNLLAKMNQRLKRDKTGSIDEDVLDSAMEERKPIQVSVFVTAEEVLPVICWSREATAARGMDESRRRKANKKRRNALKFYLIDCRSELAAQEQGRFPTAFHLSPETLHDPEKLQEHEETLESFRGAVHIVIMGEGFSAIPNLYNQKLSPKLQELMEQDESRTNLCALFFQKRGFCFVSLLTGGFCAAHSWLVRNGPQHHLNVSSVLVDYSPEKTLFGQLETLQNASMTEKAQRKMSNLLEASMTTVTKRAIQLERLTAELNDGKDGQRQGFRKLFGRVDGSTSVVSVQQHDGVETVPDPNSASTDDANIAMDQGGTIVGLPPKTSEETDGSDPTEAPVTSNSETSSSAPTKELISAGVSSAATPASTGTPIPVAASTVSTSATNKLGKFFQQTTEAVGAAAAVAAATASSTIAQTSHRNETTAATSNNTNNSKGKEEMSNPFKGFGAAFQQTRARFGNASSGTATAVASSSPATVAAATTTTTTPLADTNSTTTKNAVSAATPPSSSTSPSNTGFGFNAFRKSTMSRVLQKASAVTQQPQSRETSKTEDDMEISVSFV